MSGVSQVAASAGYPASMLERQEVLRSLSNVQCVANVAGHMGNSFFRMHSFSQHPNPLTTTRDTFAHSWAHSA